METTLRDILFDPEEDQHYAMAKVLSGGRGAAPFLKVAPAKDFAEALWEVLDLPLGEVVFGAWEKCDEIRDALEKTQGSPPTKERVSLANHTIRWSYQPTFEAVMNNKVVARVEANIAFVLKLDGAVLLISAGKLEGVAPGAGTASAELRIANEKLAETVPMSVTLPALIKT
jgi:hypothetical protein